MLPILLAFEEAADSGDLSRLQAVHGPHMQTGLPFHHEAIL